MKVQPKPDDKVALDPHRSEPRRIQVFGGGTKAAVLDMRSVSWSVLAPLWERPLVSHNAMFELAVLAKRGIRPRMDCSMQAAGLRWGWSSAGSTMRASGTWALKCRRTCRPRTGVRPS